jgi:hypothetical protein
MYDSPFEACISNAWFPALSGGLQDLYHANHLGGINRKGALRKGAAIYGSLSCFSGVLKHYTQLWDSRVSFFISTISDLGTQCLGGYINKHAISRDIPVKRTIMLNMNMLFHINLLNYRTNSIDNRNFDCYSFAPIDDHPILNSECLCDCKVEDKDVKEKPEVKPENTDSKIISPSADPASYSIPQLITAAALLGAGVACISKIIKTYRRDPKNFYISITRTQDVALTFLGISCLASGSILALRS